jgi:hypothetical protein
MSKRAERRHHARRIIKREYRRINHWDKLFYTVEENWDRARKRAACPHPCSGECCGNQRPYYGPSVGERRMMQRGEEDARS